MSIGILLIAFVKNAYPRDSLPEELDESIIIATPLENTIKRHSQKLILQSNYFDQLQNSTLLQSRELGSTSISMRGSLASDRVFHYYKKAPLNLGNGTGTIYDLLGEDWIHDMDIIKSPASNIFGNGSMNGAIGLNSAMVKRPYVKYKTSSLDTHSLSSVIPHKQKQLSITLEKNHKSYSHKAGHGYNKGRIKENGNELYRISYTGSHLLSNQAQLKYLFLQSRNKGSNPPITSYGGITNYFDRDSYFATAFLEKDFDYFIQSYYLKADNHNLYNGSFSEFVSDRSGIILEKTFIVDNSLLLQPGVDIKTFSTKDVTSSYSLNKKKEELDTYLQAVIPFKSWMIEPQIRYLWEYKTYVTSTHFTRSFYNKIYWLSYAQGYHTPTLSDLYSDTSYNDPNPNLKPETSEQIEVGFKNQHFDIRSFYLNYKDLHQAVEIAPSVTQKQNISSAYSYGVEIKKLWTSLLHEFQLMGSYIESHKKGGDPIDFTPTYQSLAKYSYFFGPAKWSIYMKHWSDYYSSGEASNDWTSWNFSIETLNLQKWQAKIYWENITRRQISYSKSYPEPLDVLRFDLSYFF